MLHSVHNRTDCLLTLWHWKQYVYYSPHNFTKIRRFGETLKSSGSCSIFNRRQLHIIVTIELQIRHREDCHHILHSNCREHREVFQYIHFVLIMSHVNGMIVANHTGYSVSEQQPRDSFTENQWSHCFFCSSVSVVIADYGKQNSKQRLPLPLIPRSRGNASLRSHKYNLRYNRS